MLEYGWAYGSEGHKLRGKILLSAVTSGGDSHAYTETGANRHTIRTFFSPFDQTAHLCGMRYANPFVVHGARGITEEEIREASQSYVNLLNRYLQQGELP